MEIGDFLKGMFSLEGRTGIVTGASSGIGAGIAETLVGAGATVYDFSTQRTKPAEVPGIERVKVDIADPVLVEKAVAEAAAAGGGLDFLVNNAGVTQRRRAEEVSLEEWRRIHTVNVEAMFLLSRACFSHLSRSPSVGRIVNISSMAAYMGFSEVVPYCSSKAAVTGLTRGLAVEWADRNILVNSISPGWIPSKMNRQVMDAERRRKIMSKILLGRFGEPGDIGAMALFLLGDGARYITGQDFSVDGGSRAFGF